MRDELLDYYERELVFLRRMGAEFAQKYPKVAARLLIDEERIEDPHVERLVESVFLSQQLDNLRVHLRLASGFQVHVHRIARGQAGHEEGGSDDAQYEGHGQQQALDGVLEHAVPGSGKVRLR